MMMQPYYAHKTDDGRVQTVHEHCAQVAEIWRFFIVGKYSISLRPVPRSR